MTHHSEKASTMIDRQRSLSLDGDAWRCKPYLGLDWQMRAAHKPGSRDTRGWIPATVPGSVQHDLWQAGEIPNPTFERNSLSLEWVPQRSWVYKRTFVVDEALREQRARLCFEGLDFEAHIFLNGELLGTHRSMFTPAAFEVGDKLRYGEENLLVVVLEPAPQEQPQIGRTSVVRTHKTRMNYWWDFCPRIVHLGIWDSVHLDFTGAIRLEDVWVRPQLNADYDKASITTELTLDSTRDTPAGLSAVAITVTLLDPQGVEIAAQCSQHHLRRGKTQLALKAAIAEPQLWWPNGFGAQPLYTAEITVAELHAGSESISDSRSVTFGIRHIVFLPNDTPDLSAHNYTLTVNGRKCFIKGWNWVPLDALYGVERPTKLEELLTLAQRAHVNLLRVWGGGLIEKENFYALCDRLGLLVWQEFIQSSSGIDNTPPQDEAFIAMLVREATCIIRRKRNHAALALWCGGNELMSAPDKPLDEAHPVLAALRATVARLDPDRHWLPTSSSGPEFSNGMETIARNPLGMHDVHGPWEHQGLTQHFTLYNAGQSLLHSEFGVEGITNRQALNTVIAPEHQSPINLDNPLWMHLAAWWVKAPMWERVFGAFPDVETAVRATQFMQADGLRYAIEADRRRKWHNSGTLPWQFNEPFPMAACTSAVDYFARPKPAYYAVAHAYEPVHIAARFARQAWAGEPTFEAETWVSNSELHPLRGILSWRIAGASGRVYAAQEVSADVAANAATQLEAITYDLGRLEEAIFFLDLALKGSDGALLSANRYIFSKTENLAPLFAVPATTVATTCERTETQWSITLTNTGATAALFIWLEDARAPGTNGSARFYAAGLSPNHFSLFPGERRTVTLTWHGVPEAARSLDISSWNTPLIHVTSPVSEEQA